MTKDLPAEPDREPDAITSADELPVVARMVIEIRSDGTRTVARGALEDMVNGQQVAVEAAAGSPLELSRALAKLLFSAPFSALLGSGESRRTGLRGSVGALGRSLGRRLGVGRDED